MYCPKCMSILRPGEADPKAQNPQNMSQGTQQGGKGEEQIDQICSKWLQDQDPSKAPAQQLTLTTSDTDDKQEETGEAQELEQQLKCTWMPEVAKQAIKTRLETIAKLRGMQTPASCMKNNINSAMDVKVLAEKMVALKHQKSKLMELHQKKWKLLKSKRTMQKTSLLH